MTFLPTLKRESGQKMAFFRNKAIVGIARRLAGRLRSCVRLGGIV